MRDYSKMSGTFWTHGGTGRRIIGRGSEATIVAVYLMTSPHSNMLGLYVQPMLYMAHETGLGIEGTQKGLAACIECGFCEYDETSQTVWVPEMAAYQVALALKAGDKRCAGVQNSYDALPDNPFLSAFFDRYAEPFHLTRKRELPSPIEGASQAPYQAPPKPVLEQSSREQSSSTRSQAPSGKPRKLKPAEALLPDGFAISERVRAWAAKNGHGRLDDRLEHFVGKARAKGYRYTDWDEAFMGAIREDWAKLGRDTAPFSGFPGAGVMKGEGSHSPPAEKSFTLAEIGLEEPL